VHSGDIDFRLLAEIEVARQLVVGDRDATLFINAVALRLDAGDLASQPLAGTRAQNDFNWRSDPDLAGFALVDRSA
jgi:hypothetical protein